MMFCFFNVKPFLLISDFSSNSHDLFAIDSTKHFSHTMLKNYGVNNLVYYILWGYAFRRFSEGIPNSVTELFYCGIGNIGS